MAKSEAPHQEYRSPFQFAAYELLIRIGVKWHAHAVNDQWAHVAHKSMSLTELCQQGCVCHLHVQVSAHAHDLEAASSS